MKLKKKNVFIKVVTVVKWPKDKCDDCVINFMLIQKIFTLSLFLHQTVQLTA